MSRLRETVNRHSGMMLCLFCIILAYGESASCLSLRERCPSAARTERGNNDYALSVSFADSSPRGRSKILT